MNREAVDAVANMWQWAGASLVAMLLHSVVYHDVAAGASQTLSRSPRCFALALTVGVALLDHLIVGAMRSGTTPVMAALLISWLFFVSNIVWLAAIGVFGNWVGFLRKISRRERGAIVVLMQVLVATPLPVLILLASDLAGRGR
jgi:hypothetical protein